MLYLWLINKQQLHSGSFPYKTFSGASGPSTRLVYCSDKDARWGTRSIYIQTISFNAHSTILHTCSFSVLWHNSVCRKTNHFTAKERLGAAMKKRALVCNDYSATESWLTLRGLRSKCICSSIFFHHIISLLLFDRDLLPPGNVQGLPVHSVPQVLV